MFQVSVRTGLVGDGFHGSIGHASSPVAHLFAGLHVLLSHLLVAVVVVDGVVVVDNFRLRIKWAMNEPQSQAAEQATYHIVDVVRRSGVGRLSVGHRLVARHRCVVATRLSCTETHKQRNSQSDLDHHFLKAKMLNLAV